MTRSHLLACHASASRAGFKHFAAAIAELYRKQFGHEIPTTAALQRHAVKQSFSAHPFHENSDRSDN